MKLYLPETMYYSFSTHQLKINA